MTPPPARRWPAARPFLRHYAEMLIAMFAGMLLLAPLWTLLADRLGWRDTFDRNDLSALVMATTMSIGMAAWMLFRRHTLVSVAQMSASMYVPFLALFPLLWTGVIDGGTLMLAGHVLMLPCMAGAMLLRPEEYAGHHHRHATASPTPSEPMPAGPAPAGPATPSAEPAMAPAGLATALAEPAPAPTGAAPAVS
ncbi:hypothetical protein ACFFWC_07670 [Plantactinospora siamensis]|uniref:Flagellar biosynthetic protein FliP n=1 Tax=Plantactinospora siamensis TaxID=555372 RepID=A0ABV6NZ27_9ACTN